MSDPSGFSGWGLPGLFLAAILAGSFVPMPSKAVLAAVLAGGISPGVAVTVATVGNVLGAISLYLLGQWSARGSGGRLERWLARRKARDAAHLVTSSWRCP